MKLNTEKKDVAVAGAKSTRNFTLEMNGKAFAVLTDGMYKNKKGSLVREIACNAKDAHTQAGKPDEPFSIHLPDVTEPWFSVQDFGVGLSPEQVETIYCQFFKSTKDQSNDQIGAFGLGSKTPFSYSPEFSITSVYDGIEYHYSVYQDEYSNPQISLMAENKTDKQNGLTVTVPIKREDFNDFRVETARQLKYFKVKPNIHNCATFEWPILQESAMTIGSVEILNGNSWNGEITIIQGGVGYPLDINEITGHLDSENRAILNTLRESSARMTFDIGQINVTSSRESVKYDEQTIKNIADKLTQFRKEMNAELNRVLKQESSDWNRALKLNNNSTLNKIARNLDYKIPNAYVNNGNWKFNASDYFGETVEVNHTMDDGTIRSQRVFRRYFKIVLYRKNQSGNITMKTSKDVDTLLAHKSTKALYLRDTSKQPVARIKHEMITNDMNEMYVVCVCPDNANAITTAFSKKVMKKISKQFGGLPTTLVSSLDKPPAPIRNTVNYDKPVGYMIQPETSWMLRDLSTSTYDWNRAYGALEDIEPSVYVECDRYDILGTPSDVFKKMYALVECGLSDVTVYGFNRVNTEKIKKNDGWVSLQEYVETEYPRIEPLFKDYRKLARFEVLRDTYYNKQIDYDNLNKLYELRSMLDKNSIGEWYIRFQHLVNKAYNFYYNKMDEKQTRFYRLFNTQLLSDARAELGNECEENKENSLMSRWNKATNLFRLIPDGWRHWNDSKTEHIIQYVNCMSKGA